MSQKKEIAFTTDLETALELGLIDPYHQDENEPEPDFLPDFLKED